MNLSESTCRLPPLTALRAFEAASRHMSFAKAAEELFVTPAALSYQIKSLEEHLGQPLFRRLNRAVELTEAGRALRPGVAEGFEALIQAVRNLERLSASNVLTVTAGPGFTAKWLAPRFFRFAEAHPGIELRFVASLKIMDFDRDRIDAAIRFGSGSIAKGSYSETLADDWVMPVCTPGLTATLGTPADLARQTLIHDDSLVFMDPCPDWPMWLKLAAVEADGRRGPRFSNADHAVDAAQDGGGVVLARASLVERDLVASRLVAPFRLGIDTSGQFRFVCPAERETSPLIETFLDWLRSEMVSLAELRKEFDVRPLTR